MSEPLEPKPKTHENEMTETKPRYEAPQVIDLSKMGQAQGGSNCGTGSADANNCYNGPTAQSTCSTGNIANPSPPPF